MLDSTIAKSILNGLFAMGLNRNEDGMATSNFGNQISFSGNLYLGLLTQMPGADGSDFKEPTDSNYKRIRIDTKSRINKKNFIDTAKAEEKVLTDNGLYATPVSVTNQGAILFPEAGADWNEIVGFGIFRNGSAGSTAAPILWGAVTTTAGEPLAVNAGEVPVIRTGGFKVSLM
jgi:hypothetical protein